MFVLLKAIYKSNIIIRDKGKVNYDVILYPNAKIKTKKIFNKLDHS